MLIRTSRGTKNDSQKVDVQNLKHHFNDGNTTGHCYKIAFLQNQLNHKTLKAGKSWIWHDGIPEFVVVDLFKCDLYIFKYLHDIVRPF